MSAVTGWSRPGRRGVTPPALAILLGLLLALPAPALAGPAEARGDGIRLGSGSGLRHLGRGPADAIRPSGRRYAEGVVLVQYKPGARPADRAAARGAVAAASHRPLSRLAHGAERLSLARGVSVEAAIRELERHGAVRYAEPDYLVTADHAPSDELYSARHLLWGMYGPNSNPASDYGSGAGEAWETYELGSRDVVVGILDTGVDISHKDLAPNVWTNPGEVAGNHVDDDGNGYVDDVHGWDFFHDDASVFDSAAADYHGTHVAGTIGAAGSNGDEGVVGVSWAVSMIPAKFIQGEGSTSDAIAALDYLTDLKSRYGLNLVATNNSWGGPEESQALEDAINRGGDAGILFVAAAGNDGEDIDDAPTFPASHACVTKANDDPRGFDCLLSVAAITETGGLAGFSNYGATSVDIGAPGEGILSTYPGNDYVYLDGTSMAAPHVTGAIALLASCQDTSTAELLRDSVIDNGAATPSLGGVTSTGDRLQVGPMMADCDLAGPRALITPDAGGTDTPASMRVWFSEPVAGLELDDFTIGGTSTGWSLTQIGTFPDAAGPYFLTLSATSPPAGTLTVTLEANSVTGDGGTGPATATTATIRVDRTSPTITTPALTISDIDGLDGSAIPVRMTWTGSDTGSGVKGYDLQYSINGGAWTPLVSNGGLRTPGATVWVPASGTIRFRARTLDWPGHVSAWGVSPTVSPRLVQEGASAVDFGGSWSTASSSLFSGGKVRFTSTGKRSATYSFKGRAVSLITTMGPSRGVVKVKVDGDLVATVDMSWPNLLYRQVIWSKRFSSVRSHTVKVIVVGGQGRVDVDAFAVLK